MATIPGTSQRIRVIENNIKGEKANMNRNDSCVFSNLIMCQHHDRCNKCTWNPAYYAKLKQQRREERESRGRRKGAVRYGVR